MLKFILLFLLMIFSSLAYSDKVSDANIKPFLIGFSQSYFSQESKLLLGYAKYKDTSDYAGFVNFKNKIWTAGLEKELKKYEQIQKDNSGYFFDNGLNTLVSSFINLRVIANLLFFELRRGDQKNLTDASNLLLSDRGYLKKIYKDHGLDIAELADKVQHKYSQQLK